MHVQRAHRLGDGELVEVLAFDTKVTSTLRQPTAV